MGYPIALDLLDRARVDRKSSVLLVRSVLCDEHARRPIRVVTPCSLGPHWWAAFPTRSGKPFDLELHSPRAHGRGQAERLRGEDSRRSKFTPKGALLLGQITLKDNGVTQRLRKLHRRVRSFPNFIDGMPITF